MDKKQNNYKGACLPLVAAGKLITQSTSFSSTLIYSTHALLCLGYVRRMERSESGGEG